MKFRENIGKYLAVNVFLHASIPTENYKRPNKSEHVKIISE